MPLPLPWPEEDPGLGMGLFLKMDCSRDSCRGKKEAVRKRKRGIARASAARVPSKPGAQPPKVSSINSAQTLLKRNAYTCLGTHVLPAHTPHLSPVGCDDGDRAAEAGVRLHEGCSVGGRGWRWLSSVAFMGSVRSATIYFPAVLLTSSTCRGNEPSFPALRVTL